MTAQAATPLRTDSTPPLADAVEWFLEGLQATDNTRAAYWSDLSPFTDRFTTPHHSLASAATTTHRQAGRRPLTLTGVEFAPVSDYLRHERANHAKDATVNHWLSALRSFFRWCMRNGAGLGQALVVRVALCGGPSLRLQRSTSGGSNSPMLFDAAQGLDEASERVLIHSNLRTCRGHARGTHSKGDDR